MATHFARGILTEGHLISVRHPAERKTGFQR